MTARWSERQVAMLREMGVQHFWPLQPEAEAPASAAPHAALPVSAVPVPAAGGLVSASSAVAQALPERPATSAPARPPMAPARPGGVSAPVARTATDAPVTLGARPAGIESMDWATLRDTVSGCQACGLCKGRRQTVFGVGHTRARWMLVGEAPGEQEDRLGEPFVGRAGQLLDRMLTSVGLTRAEDEAERQVYIANVIKCRPPGNRNPLPEEVAQCEPYLLRQLALVQPRLILAMGRFAVQSLLKSSEPIGRLRGRVHDYHGVPLVVTYHPAYLLRNPADKALAWDDLCLARELAQSAP